MKKAWQMERELRDSAVPIDRRKESSAWFEAGFEVPYGDALISLFWESKTPGSGSPEIPYQEMTQSMDNQGFDVSQAEALLAEGIDLHKKGDKDQLRVLTARLLHALNTAPKIKNHPYHQYQHPETWEQVLAAMPAAHWRSEEALLRSDLGERIHQGWLGQLAGGSFGTAIEGYTGRQIEKVYGKVTDYITQPETTNDDVVYELILLDVYERMGAGITSEAIGLEWVRQIPFGWSAEWIALRNLGMGLMPPDSGSFLNPYSDWIGAQMRGMICGMLAPADPLKAARLAHLDGVVSHSRNGVYGEIFASVLTSLAFLTTEPRQLVQQAAGFIPAQSEYAAKLDFVVKTLEKNSDPQDALPALERHFEEYNWIHAYPNMAADVFSLWYGNGDFTESMALLAQAGNDVDCNAGLVGNVLGVMRGVPARWADPIGDLLETYITGKEKLSIRGLSEKTTRLALSKQKSS